MSDKKKNGGRSLEEVRRKYMVRKDKDGEEIPPEKSFEERAEQGIVPPPELEDGPYDVARRYRDLRKMENKDAWPKDATLTISKGKSATARVPVSVSAAPKYPKNRPWLFSVILGGTNGLDDAILKFGSKHRGQAVSTIAEKLEGRSYLRWIIREEFPVKLQRICEIWLEWALKGKLKNKSEK